MAVALGLGLAQPVGAHQPQRQWARQPGTPAGEIAWAVATDKQGNVYIGGHTFGSLGGARGEGDAWINKYSAAGVLLWKRQLGTSDFDQASEVATDNAGNVYIAGYTFGSLAAINHGLNDAWIARYSAAGVLLWKRQLGTAGVDVAWGVATDEAGNVYFVGETGGSLLGAYRGGKDAWIAKYSPAGVLLWKQQFGTPFLDQALGVATDDKGGVYIAGTTNGSLYGPAQGATDAWIVKYESD